MMNKLQKIKNPLFQKREREKKSKKKNNIKYIYFNLAPTFSCKLVTAINLLNETLKWLKLQLVWDAARITTTKKI